MPKGPNGQTRPADAIGLAVMVGRIATGETTDTHKEPSAKASAGGKARAERMTPEQRSENARRASAGRWG